MSSMRASAPRCSVFGLLAAVLALLGQIALSPVLPAKTALPDAALFGDIPICHSGALDSSNSGAPAEHGQHGMQCALCPVCHALASAAFLPVPTPQPLAPPTALIALHAPASLARVPPTVAVLAATYPTGPPNLA